MVPGYRSFHQDRRTEVPGLPPVEVLEKRSVVGEEGLIGADVFGELLVELDFPRQKLRLSELPKRPDDPAGPAGLRTAEGNSSLSDCDETDSSRKMASAADKPSLQLRDAYVAPEMKSLTRVLRFGHMVLVPTAVGKVQGKLFLMDTGALENHITPAAAREVTKVHGDSDNDRYRAQRLGQGRVQRRQGSPAIWPA